ncbi:MAG: M56 family metallopeptidase [Vallitalea sp.]|nr:M56 family metallopeptidase [Vallitalea sp.]
MFNIDFLFDLCIITTIKGIIMILLVLGLQRIFKLDFTSKWNYALWSLVIIRLLIPTTPIENVLSLYNFGIIKRFKFTINDLLLGRLGSSDSNFEFIGNKISVMSLVDNSFKFDWIHFFSILWVIGVMLLFIVFIYINVKLFTLLRHRCHDEKLLHILESCKIKLDIKKNIHVYISNVSSPMTFGILFPRIVISEDVITHLNEKQLEYIFLHELVHIKRHDVLFNFLGMIVCIIYWFNPLIWYVFFKSKKDCELACDETVLKYLDHEEYVGYGHTLIQMLQLSISNNIGNSLVTKALINDRSEANARIFQIKTYHKKRKSVIVLSVFFLMFIGFLGLNEDTSTRPFMSYNKENLYNLLDSSEEKVLSSFGNPVHKFYIKVKDKPYNILFYNILGEKVEFWYDGNIGHTKRKLLEITTTSYKDIHQNMRIPKAKEIASKNNLELITVKTFDYLTKYIYKDNNYFVMLLADNKTNKVYSISLY